jgi:hypothetical protein
MGFITSGETLTLTAKFTPVGRAKLIANTSSLVTSFGLGDSDANYNTILDLGTGNVPSNGGALGVKSTVSNSVAPNVKLRSNLILGSSGLLVKPVEDNSSTIISELKQVNSVVLDSTKLSQKLVNKLNTNLDENVNLFHSFGLPITSSEVERYTSIKINANGFLDTALSGIASNNIIVIGFDDASCGEMIDGKSIQLHLNTSTGIFNIYSTFMNKGTDAYTEDAKYSETMSSANEIGNNIAFLFSDQIQKPNNDSTLSWSTGFGSHKPFSVNNKELFNLTSDESQGKVADICVGVAYLDMGFIVITHPTITNNFFIGIHDAQTSVSATTLSTVITQSFTCLAKRGEFGGSTNTTYKPSDIPRISEVALYDADMDMIAIAKTDRQVERNVNEYLALNITINF